MKFTKLMALALVLVMLVSAFVACGGGTDTETEPPVTETNPPETESETESETETETETDPPCEHPANRRRPMDEVAPTCTEDGYIDYLCRLCDEQWREVVPATHTYGDLNSVDGKYVRHTCVECGEFYVTDETGATVADPSGIIFPFFSADFTDKTSLSDAVAAFPSVKLTDGEGYVDVVVNEAEENTYLNIPFGTSALAPNGYFVLSDVNNELATKDFAVELAVRFTEYPVEAISLLTWKLGGTEYDLLTIDATGKISVLGSEQSKILADKGWDVLKVCFDYETSDYYVYMNDEIFAKGNIGASVSGKTESSVRFFEGASQFEAYIDDISIQFIEEAKTDACIHVYSETSKTAATCDADGKVSYKCSVCNNTYDEVLPALGHKLGAPAVKDPTCTATGSSTAVCATCNKQIVEEIPATGHTVEWELVDGTPVQTCSNCSYNAIFRAKGDAVLALDFDKPVEEAVGDKITIAKNTATIVDQDGNMVLDVKTTEFNDSENHVIYGTEYMLFTARAKFAQHSYSEEKKESLISFTYGRSGCANQVGQASSWGICLAVISSTDGTTKLAMSKTPKDGESMVVNFDEWYDITIIGDNSKYYVFVGDTLLGSVKRPDHADPMYAGGATLRIGEYGNGESFLDDIMVFEIAAE